MNKINVWEVEQFQSGKKNIAITTAAGSTGISLHASLTPLTKNAAAISPYN